MVKYGVMFELEELPADALKLPPEQLRRRELHNYLHWFISIRWAIAGAVVLLGSLVLMGLFPAARNGFIISSVGLVLFAGNLLFVRLLRQSRQASYQLYDSFIYLQIFLDFAAITALSFLMPPLYGLFILSYTFHLVLSCVFLERKKAFPVLLAACLGAISIIWFAAPPGVFDAALQKVFGSSHTGSFLDNLIPVEVQVLLLYTLGIPVCFTGVWFLTSEIALDIIQREMMLAEKNKRMAELSDEKNRLTIRATHELKAPFAAVKSYLLVLRDGLCGELPPKAVEVVQKMLLRTDRLTSNISDIIRLSNLKTTVFQEDRFQTLNIIPIVRGCIRSGQEEGMKRNIRIMELIPDKNLPLPVAKDEFRIMFNNLVFNAVTYSRDNGWIKIMVRNRSSCVEFIVSDRGIGIKHSALENIFQEHYRTNEAASFNPNGNGLGLAIVWQIVSLHKGSIRVVSVEGKGTIFRVKLPKTRRNQK
jgi:signal transduction histidine kinase